MQRETNSIDAKPIPKEFESKAFATWRQNFLANFMQIRSDSRKIKTEIKSMLDTAYFPNSAVKDEAVRLEREAAKIERRSKAHIDSVKIALSYTSETGKRDEDKENEARDMYINRYLSGSETRKNNFTRDLTTLQNSWNSIRGQIIDNRGPR